MGRQLKPQNAKTIAIALESRLAGKGMRAIANELNRRGLTTPLGRPWNEGRVTKALAGHLERLHDAAARGLAFVDDLVVPLEEHEKAIEDVRQERDAYKRLYERERRGHDATRRQMAREAVERERRVAG